MVLNGLGALCVVMMAKFAFSIDHEQNTGNAVVFGAFLEFRQIGIVFGFVFEELVYILDSVDPKIVLSVLCEIQIVELLSEQCFCEATTEQEKS